MDLVNLFARGEVVKICGLCQPEHAEAAARAGADLIGFIFADARRQVSPSTASACIEAAKAVREDVVAVGVFVDARPVDVLAVLHEAGLDAVQLHGRESPDYVAELYRPAIKVLRPASEPDPVKVAAEIEIYLESSHPPVGFLIDGYSKGLTGGSGVRADWDMAAIVCATRGVMLAGGLDPANVGAAIRRVKPSGVDVSSGVEVDGMKDPERIKWFIREARAAYLKEREIQGSTRVPSLP